MKNGYFIEFMVSKESTLADQKTVVFFKKENTNVNLVGND